MSSMSLRRWDAVYVTAMAVGLACAAAALPLSLALFALASIGMVIDYRWTRRGLLRVLAVIGWFGTAYMLFALLVMRHA